MTVLSTENASLTVRATLTALATCALRRGDIGHAPEVLAPVVTDPASAVPLGVVTAAGRTGGGSKSRRAHCP